jgi:predicted alpha/beta-fold hydrolase
MVRVVSLMIFLMCCSICSRAQLWIDKQFAYDSVLNITYGTAIDFNGDTDTLLMDVFIPKCTTAGTSATYKPLLLWIHGGAFLAGDKNDPSIQNLCKQFAKRGYVTATISYRLGFCSDDALWQCNYPNYSCVFASDSAEWVRSYYRAVQDAKGALRHLVNRFEQYGIDTSNIFVAGESAGAFTALGVALLDTASERPPQTYALPNAPKPHIGTATCTYNLNKTFSNSGIARPDLGDIAGTIEPTTINYTIRGIGNMYGAMLGD